MSEAEILTKAAMASILSHDKDHQVEAAKIWISEMSKELARLDYLVALWAPFSGTPTDSDRGL